MQAIRVDPVGSDSDRFRLQVSSNVEIVGDAVETVLNCCRNSNDTSQTVRFRICTVVAEALANAMLYGNASDPSRDVSVEVEVVDEVITISVTDQGDGFNYRQYIDAPLQPPDATGGRGLYLIRHLADGVRFNEKGNSICMMLRRS